ncbi:hypothetical protein AGMMS50229_15280 [Campylobacterota bacterium]|nr:hypothetical protein AGMMS50229_15280 [Campylobacterota bacterium]
MERTMQKTSFALLSLVTLLLGCFGGGADRDYEDAMKLYNAGDYVNAMPIMTKSAQNGNIDAQFYLGVMYSYTTGEMQDLTMALHWFSEAANAGHIHAANNLGIAYYNGYGVVRDYKAAFRWFHIAAKGGNAEAQSYVAKMYREGQGMEAPNAVQADYWLKKSASTGN